MPAESYSPPVAAGSSSTFAFKLLAHLRIARFDHSIKQAFLIPGIVLAIAIGQRTFDRTLAINILLGVVAATLIACSNYVLNEILDAPFDRLHPTKSDRPAACGSISVTWAYAQWIAMMVAGLLLASRLPAGFFWSAAALWIMGCVYNIPPVRTKDLPYLDVLSESLNNPLRFCLGWYMVEPHLLPPASMLVSYWMLGAYFMGLKRFSEYRQIAEPALAAKYRRSFHYYTEEKLLNSALFYAAASMLFFGAFLMRYRIELILTFPLVAWLMAIYFSLSFHSESSVQNPEKLYREPKLMLVLGLCICLFVVLLFVHMPWITDLFPKSQP